MNQRAFSTLSLPAALLSNVQDLGYQTMTPIQAQSLPVILAGRDVIAQAKTGSGKTAAFGLGILAQLKVEQFRVQSLVLCPTRELANQVTAELRRLARSIHNIKILTLCGGMPIGPQIGSLEHGAHIIVGTPGRVVDHVNQGRLNLHHVTNLVLDEADRMLEMGFQDELDVLFEHLPQERQNLLFSATYPPAIANMAERLLNQPEWIKIEATAAEQSAIEQRFYQIEHTSPRLQALRSVLLKHNSSSAMVFCTTKRETQEVADELASWGFSALALHGDMDQKDRDHTLVKFANGSVCVLVATDVAARGLDISQVDVVCNYQLAHDAETHTHRIGRTGRAGQQGLAISLVTERDLKKINSWQLVGLESMKTEALPMMASSKILPTQPVMATLQLDSGKKNKLRPGDILGALTAQQTLMREDIGKIQVHDIWSFVAVRQDKLKEALKIVQNHKIKGRAVRSRVL